MAKIVYSPDGEDFLFDLVHILYKEEYFGFFESSAKYVQNIIDEIDENLPKVTHHETPKELKHYGKYYATVKGSKRTTWYIVFNKNENRFSVKYITNNHAPDANYFNGL